MIFIVGGRRQQTSNVLIEIIVNSNLRKEENYIYTKGVYLWQCFVGGEAFHEVLFSFENKSIRELWEARALILLRSHLRTGGTVKRQVACLSRVVLIEMVGDKSSTIQEFFSFYFHSFQRKNGGACCSRSWKAALSFKSFIEVCQSQLNNSQKVGGRIK